MTCKDENLFLRIQKASIFESDITLMKNGLSVTAKSIMGVMCIAIRKKEDITLVADSINEQAAVKNLETFLSNKQ
ncbi:HPr family phosphocarrier protein [Priestia megaterium]|uniref:HPr family phosphocarrier protein n=1 Tax=Priestia megaterium TaxID=1404 RepID=UPI0020D26F4D|nr:HPr family phosphocarrier protein [Priestia megaterium]